MNAKVKMKVYGTGLMILTMVAMIDAQETQKLAAKNDRVSIQGVSTNASDERIEEYLNPGEPIKVTVGQKFSIRIASNPTTGYGWQLSKPVDENVVILITNVYIQKQTGTLRVGVGGHEVWTFKAVGQGQTDISLRYIRSWEKNRPPANTNVFIVIVK